VEGSQALFQVDMGLEGATDEADSAGTGTEAPHGVLFGSHDPWIGVQTQIAVGIHA
jgi:hypothetical protein